jgi:aspartyl-tRNA(Asn)/glutamyl-tRNA(Gln) amidotransferase subunit B
MELGGLFKNEQWSDSRVPSEQLASIIVHLLNKQITGRTAKMLLARIFEGDYTPVDQIIADEELILQPLSQGEYRALAQKLIEEKPAMVADIVQKGQHQKVKWFVGQMMARGAEGTVEPGTAEAVMIDLLNLPAGEQK